MARKRLLGVWFFLLLGILPVASSAQDRPDAPASSSPDNRSLIQKADKLFAAQKYTEAFPLYSQAAQSGDAHAMLRLGNLYEAPSTANYAQAMQWYQKAHGAGDAATAIEAAACLGMMYSQGRGVKPDAHQASIWFLEAAEGGNPAAMVNLGVLYFQGRGVPQDQPQAVSWFRKAADFGLVPAMEKLSRIYEAGQGAPKDLKEARRWYEKAAARGSSLAKFRLATFGRAAFDISGEWEGFDAGSFVPRRLRITQSGGKLTAVRYHSADRTKGTADFLRGAFSDDPYIVPVEVDQYTDSFLGFLHDSVLTGLGPGVVQAPSDWKATVLTLQDPDHFRIGRMIFERVSMPSLDDVPCYPDNPLKVQPLFALARGQNSLKANHSTDAACWYRLGAFQESTPSMISFADLLRQGLGVKQNYPVARAWLERATKAGDLNAAMELSGMDDLGEGAPADHAKAEALRKKVQNIKVARLRAKKEQAAEMYAMGELLGGMLAESDPDCSDSPVIVGDPTLESISRQNRIEERDAKIASGELHCGTAPWGEGVQNAALETMMQQAPDDPRFEKAGRDLMALVESNDFEAIAEIFSPAMKSVKVTPTTMRGTWSRMNQKLGAYRGIVASTRVFGKPMVDVICAFDHGRGNVRFVFDENGAISGLWFQEAPLRFWPSDLGKKLLNDDD